jgi:hypothetical protein
MRIETPGFKIKSSGNCGSMAPFPKQYLGRPYESRLGEMPASEMHWITGAPGVNVKTGFPVSNAKVVLPSPP